MWYVDDVRCRSVCLLMQAALPCMLFARGPTRLQLRGGTNAAFAPQIDYFIQVGTFTLTATHSLSCNESVMSGVGRIQQLLKY